MARKRKLGLTTPARYKLKMFRLVAAGVPEELALDFADKVVQSWQSGFGAYANAHKAAVKKLMELGVPSALHGLYIAFVNELLHKVNERKIATVDEIIEKWERQGLDGGILRQLAEYLGFTITEETPKAAEKV